METGSPTRGRQQAESPVTQAAAFSPLSAGVHGQRSRGSLGSPRSSRDSLLDSESQQPSEQQLPQLPQIQTQPQLWQQQDVAGAQPVQQQQQVHGTAYVSVSGRAGQDGSPRSPSRLRYVRKDSAAAVTPAAATAPKLPDFLQVQELPPGVLHEDEVEIVHQEGDEVTRQADVEDKIIRQVDQLVEYFNSLFHDDQLDINSLEQTLAKRDMELSRKNLLIQQLMAARQHHQQQEVHYDDGLWAAIKRSWQRSRCCWIMVLLLLVALVLVIALPAALVRKPGPAAPAFLYNTKQLTASNATMDFQLAVDKAAVVHYVLLQKSADGSPSGWSRMAATDVQLASQGLGFSSFEPKIAACGMLYVGANTDSSFSVATTDTPECQQQQALGANGGKHSCSRCPIIYSDTEYDMLLVAEAAGAVSGAQHIQASTGTLPTYSSKAPALKGGATVRATSTGVAEATFDLTFQVNAAGTVQFLVMYAKVYARFMDTYVVFDNAVTDPAPLLDGSIASFQNGVVARGHITVQQPGVDHTCTIGGSAAGTTCTCKPAATCAQDATCFGSLCDYSKVSLAPSTAYKVVLMPVSLDGQDRGSPAQLPPFSTGDALNPPRLSEGLVINPVVGPDRFSVFNISQDKPGFAYLLVTKPTNQVNSQVPAGTATAFIQVPGATRSRGMKGRQLTQTATPTSNLVILPPEQGASSSGAAFLPPCRTQLPCEAYVGTAREYVDEAVVFQKCVPIAKITEETQALVTSLANNTLYKVTIIPTDLNNNQDAWMAFVRTQDLAPPILTIVDTPPPDFDSFSVTAHLDEPGTLYATLLLHSQAAQVTGNAVCPPSFQGPLVGQNTYAMPVALTNSNISWSGLTANTDYILRLIAVDAVGNCQPAFTDLPVHTLDNIPPNTLVFEVVDIGGTTAGLQIALDEPGTGFFAVVPKGTTCPAAAVLFAAATTVPPGAAAAGIVAVPLGTAPVTANVTGLTSETDYTACVIAADATKLQNKQPAGLSKDFRTLDITPPAVVVKITPGTDGNFTCDRTSFMCSLAFSVSLNEAGSIAWALPMAANTSLLPSPQQLLGAADPSQLFLPGSTPKGSAQVPAAAALANATVVGLASQTAYTLVLSARDAASAPNYIPVLVTVQLTAPDVRPPTFTDVGLQGVADTTVTIRTTLDEDSNVFFVVVPYPSTMPSPAQVAGGVAANNSQPMSVGKVSATFNTSVLLVAAGLSPGSWYDIYLVAADDPAGNLQARVTNITRVRTTDSIPPIITDLTATFTPPMSLTLTYTVSKAGSLWLAPRKAGLPEPTAQEVLTAVATRSTASANFTAAVTVPTAAVSTSQTLCVVDGDKLVVYAVARDTEGQFPGRQDNTSPLKSVAVIVQPVTADASCPSLAYLQPSLAFSTAGAAQGLSLPGMLLGPRTVNGSSAGPVVVQHQQAVAFLDAAMGGDSYQLLAQIGATSTASGSIRLPGAAALAVRALPPTQIAAILRSAQLVPDANSNEGSTLRISYQLKDSAGTTQIDTAGLSIQPLLSYAQTVAAPPTGTAAANNALPNCDVSMLGAASGVGECSVVVDRKFFPTTGSLDATMTLKVLIGVAQVATAEVSGLQLLAPPVIPAFTPTSQPGVLVTMPYRQVYAGEVITVSVQAVNPLMQGITGFTLPLQYDKTLLEFREARSGDLWQEATVTTQAAGGNLETAVLSAGRSGTQSDTAYRADMNGILLVDIDFTVRATRAGAYTGALQLIRNSASLWPTWRAPFYQFNNFNGASNSAGVIFVDQTLTLGVWAWADRYDLFNTAALNGQQVSTAVRGMPVRNHGSSNGASDTPACSISTTSSPRAAAVAVDAVRRACVVTVNAVNTVPAKQLSVMLTIPDMTGDQSAQVALDIWYASNLALAAADPVLNSVLPLNVAPSTPTCAAYQSTSLRLTAVFSNGGTGPGDTIADADVTSLATFSSNDTNVAQVLGSLVKGIAPGSATITTAASSTLKLPITVSSEPACLVQLHTAATTGAAVSTASSSSSQVALVLRPGEATSLAWQPGQDLTWEDSAALVLSYARFSDGSVMDVTDKTAVTAVLPAAGGSSVLPFSLSTDNTTGLRWLTVNATVGTPTPCQQYLQSSWAVCSNAVQLGSGQGSVAVRLPQPSAVANFTAIPGSITSSDDPARLNPILVATSSSLVLQIAFADGVVRDFSKDRRVAYGLAPGSTMCEVVKGADGTWQVVTAAAGSSLTGSCTITATVTFQGGIPSLTATTSVALVGLTKLAMYALSPDLASVPAVPPASGLVQADDLLLLQCQPGGYDQRSLWTYAVLSNCTAANVCPQVDINSRQYTQLNSTNPSVAQLVAGTSSYGYPLLDNILAPTAAGTTRISSSFSNAASRSFSLTVKDTFQPSWPAAAALSDTTARVDANMSDAQMLVTYLMVPSAQLDLTASPPIMPALSTVQAGVSLVADAARGPNFLTATSTGLLPGTNYTVLASVRLSGGSSSSSQAASPTVLALTGLLVPDTAPPSFTTAVVRAVAPGVVGSNGSSSTAGATTFSIQMDLALNEDARVYYAVYGDPACITADPTPDEIRRGDSLYDIGKCNCSSRFCSAAAHGSVPFSSSNSSAAITIRANLPPFPFDNVGADTCHDFWPSSFASTKYVVFLVAEDKLPTYKGWASVCSMVPPAAATAPTPCPSVSISPCRNTPPAVESVNSQAPPFAPLDLYSEAAPAAAPLGAPIKGIAQLVDPIFPAFVTPTVQSSGTSVVFSFQISKPGLVQWRLVQQVTQVIAFGLEVVPDASLRQVVTVSRQCSGGQLVPGTEYAMWFNMTDIYGTRSKPEYSILQVTL